MSNKFNQKKQKLLARKEQLLKDLKYYEVRIEEAKRASENRWVYDDDSSDSEIEFSVKAGVSLTELRLQQSQLHTCLQATQELTGLSVLQSEVNVLVNAPTFEGEPPVLEAGCWREVMAECKIDLVSFSMSFYQHQPSRQFAQSQYRALRVLPIKLVHEKELSQSVLVEQRVPSDAVEVLRSYAQAHRSRRDSLAALAERFADALYMEAAPEGGYVLRCVELLRVTWSLQNRRSALAPFLHKMAFDLEYMDESYIKTISQAHKQLCDPALDTDHRTLLLAQIIDTCLAARRLAGPLTDSDVDSQHSRRQTSDLEMDVPTTSGLMGPPTSLPKKTKRKGKENNTPTAKDRKRENDTEGKHLLKMSSTRDSSKSSISSVHKQTNIPRLLKKPPVK
ncbi:uncharacterized protein LOC112054141 isoform X2 [Bicyclus anynana]|uniref:Uncharacterized protein LOC112054141 isoform X2 n=1 Tax=Bicyclus anynana TaxID=110368 RepID=A0ABM3M2B2_BICAN|nr:uncharacterized protein LOC112054141 isoform X2 [Bicyclus anynana]